jgi:predicted dehydrogenase
MTSSRRTFLHSSAILGASGGLLPYLLAARNVLGANERPGVGCIGNGGMGRGDLGAASRYGNILAVCDADRSHAEAVSEGGKREVFEDYRKLLDRKDIDVVTVSTPDHWHTRISIDAMKAGKDVYCQKPLTLTIDEGKMICKVALETKRVFQVGTQQRSSDEFQKAMLICRLGRLGKMKRAVAAIGGAPKGGPFKKCEPPAGLNWDLWLGQCPKVDYIKERCHGSFRWWYEYSGGKMTDWGAHHVDIATWGLGMEKTGPTAVEPVSAKHPVEFKNGMPAVDDSYNTANDFVVKCTYAGGLEIVIRNDTENGITFEGEKGSIFVSRGKLRGEAVDLLKSDPIPESAFTELRKGKPRSDHMGNFIACVKDRGATNSDVFSHHRELSTCHLANVAIRLGRTIKWDPEKEEIVGDPAANGFLAREQRKGYEIKA